MKRSAILISASMLLLSGCVSFGAKPPPSLLLLTAKTTMADGTASTGLQKDALVIQRPSVPRKLDTNRLPVQINISSVAYLKDAVWSDKPAQLMQQLLVEPIAAKNNRLVLSAGDARGQAEEILSGNLIEFGVDAVSSRAVIIYDAVQLKNGKPAKKKRFMVCRAVGAIEAGPVSRALNEAANEIAVEIADWIKE